MLKINKMMKKQRKMPPKQMSKEEFAFETRSVLLNFLSLLPTKDLNLSDSYTSSSTSGSERHKLKKAVSVNSDTGHFISFDSQFSKDRSDNTYFSNSSEDRMKISSDAEDSIDGPKEKLKRQIATDIPVLDKAEEDAFKSADLPLIPLQKSVKPSPRRPTTLSIIPDSDLTPSPPADNRFLDETNLFKATKIQRNENGKSNLPSEHHVDTSQLAHSQGMMTIPEGKPIKNVDLAKDSTHVEVNRQDSHISTISTDLGSPNSDMSSMRWSSRSQGSSRISLIDLNQIDVQSLVNTNSLPHMAVPLQLELTRQFEDLERECRKFEPTTSS